MPDQTWTAITSVMARWGSPKNADDAPSDFQTLAAGPPLGLKINEKISPTTVTPRIVGMNTTARAKLRPRSRWLSSTAMSRARTFWNSVTAIANTKVFFRAWRLYAIWAEEKKVR